MSAEALRAVMKRSTCRGPELLVQLAIAHLSNSRNGHRPKTTAKHEEIATVARMSVSRTRAIIALLIKNGRLFMIDRGKCHEPNVYELPIQGVFRDLLKADSLDLLESGSLNREDPYTQTSRADPRCEETPSAPAIPPNILPMPPPQPVTYRKRRRKA